MSWPTRDIFAVTIDGQVLVNAKAFENEDIRKLIKQKNVFVGVPLAPRDVKMLLEHLYDCSSEVAAMISGRRARRARRARRRPSGAK